MDLILKRLVFLLLPALTCCASNGALTAKSRVPRVVPPVQQAVAPSPRPVHPISRRSLPVRLNENSLVSSIRPLRDPLRAVARIGRRIARLPEPSKLPEMSGLKFPLPSGTISSPYGSRRGRLHAGVDITAKRGTPVFACADGKVIFAGTRKKYRRYGRMVIIDHGQNLCTRYAHASRILVRIGQQVRRGERIALVGSTGSASCPHLHLEVRVGKKPCDPMTYFSPSELQAIDPAKKPDFGRCRTF